MIGSPKFPVLRRLFLLDGLESVVGGNMIWIGILERTNNKRVCGFNDWSLILKCLVMQRPDYVVDLAAVTHSMRAIFRGLTGRVANSAIFRQMGELWLTRDNPISRYTCIPGAGHAVHLETPAEWRRTMGDFLAEFDVVA